MKNHFRLLYFLVYFYFGLFYLNAQTIIKPVGGYIHVATGNSAPEFLSRDVDVIVYFKMNTPIPDSIIFYMNGPHVISKSGHSMICNNLIKQLYSWKGLQFPFPAGSTFLSVEFKYSDSTHFIGRNGDSVGGIGAHFNLITGLVVDWGLKPLQDNSIYLKDNPLVIINNKKSTVINFTDSVLNNLDKLRFEFGDVYLVNVPLTPKGILINPKTGDISINGNKLDIGYYTVILTAEENSLNSYNTRTWYNFTVQVVNILVPYFQLLPLQVTDSTAIPFIKALISDKVLNYQVDYINPSGLGNYTVKAQSLLNFNKAPQLKLTKVNDTTLHISTDIFMDTGNYKVYENLPQSVSLIVTTNDSLGNCKQDMTSFYITRDDISGINPLHNNSLDIEVFPNPVTNELHLQTNSTTNLNVQIIDITGEKITEIIPFINHITINTQTFSQGIYFLQITDFTSGEISTRKIVLAR